MNTFKKIFMLSILLLLDSKIHGSKPSPSLSDNSSYRKDPDGWWIERLPGQINSCQNKLSKLKNEEQKLLNEVEETQELPGIILRIQELRSKMRDEAHRDYSSMHTELNTKVYKLQSLLELSSSSLLLTLDRHPDELKPCLGNLLALKQAELEFNLDGQRSMEKRIKDCATTLEALKQKKLCSTTQK